MLSNTVTIFRGLLILAIGSCAISASPASAQATAGCPAYPQFPDANCTGWQHTGATLSTHTASCTLSTAGAVYDSKLFNCTVVIAAPNITIKRSQINGFVDNASNHGGMLLEDVLIDGRNGGSQCVGRSLTNGITSAGFTLRRVHIRNCNQGVYAGRFTMEDSYIENINGDGTDHTEAILGTGPGPLVVRHSTIIGEANAASGPWDLSDGGVSAAVAFYVHGSFWPDITQGITFEQNYLRGNATGPVQASFCLYGGASTSGDGGNTTNGIFRNNVFARGHTNQCGRYGPLTAPASGPGSCWSNNRYDDGTVITASGVPACAQTAKPQAPTGVLAQ